MDPSTVFEMCDDDDDNGIHDVKESGVGAGTSAAEAANAANSSGAAAAAASLPSGPEGSASLRNRRAGRSVDRAEVKTKRESWMDPPGERESNTLTQAEMESCMQTYAVRASSSSWTFENRIQSVFTLEEHNNPPLEVIITPQNFPSGNLSILAIFCLISVEI